MPKQIVDWQNPERDERDGRTKWRVTCQGCGHTRWLKRGNCNYALRTGGCKKCQRREAGRKGYRATMEKHGRAYVLECIRQCQLARPSLPEKYMSHLLKSLDVPFEEQVIYEGYILDFVLSNGDVIEVNGYWHNRERQDRDKRIAELLTAEGRRVLFVDASNVDVQEVRGFLK